MEQFRVIRETMVRETIHSEKSMGEGGVRSASEAADEEGGRAGPDRPGHGQWHVSGE